MHYSKQSVLVVEDSTTMRSILHEMLSSINFIEITEAKNGDEAIEILSRKEFDIILSDWHMEPMSGIELLQHVRSNDQTRETPFIMITSESGSERILDAFNDGVTHYLNKPFKLSHLVKSLEQIFPAL